MNVILSILEQQKRELACRIKEHKNALINNNQKSNVADHAKELSHEINFENPSICNIENNNHARKFLEKWEMEKQKIKNKNLMNDQINARSDFPQAFRKLIFLCYKILCKFDISKNWSI